jgi:neutral ceramidase
MTYRILLLTLFIPTTAAADSDVPRVFRAGAATSNITPPLGRLRVGSFAPYPSLHVHDELHVRCLVLNDGETQGDCTLSHAANSTLSR